MRRGTRGRSEFQLWCGRSRLSRPDLASRLGISEPHLCNVLLGERQPSAALMLRIEQETGVPMRAWLETKAVAELAPCESERDSKSSVFNEKRQERVS